MLYDHHASMVHTVQQQYSSRNPVCRQMKGKSNELGCATYSSLSIVRPNAGLLGLEICLREYIIPSNAPVRINGGSRFQELSRRFETVRYHNSCSKNIQAKDVRIYIP